MKRIAGLLIVLLFLFSCRKAEDQPCIYSGMDAPAGCPIPVNTIYTGNTTPKQIINYARSLTGVPYKYGSTNPNEGFDCSGFITYVFNHFGVMVPRTSVDFTYAGRQVDLNDARPGDLVLFTGSDSTSGKVGHMGILVSSPGESPVFIHSTSGKEKGVTETPFYSYYIRRYVKTIRIFPQNDNYPAPAEQCISADQN